MGADVAGAANNKNIHIQTFSAVLSMMFSIFFASFFLS